VDAGRLRRRRRLEHLLHDPGSFHLEALTLGTGYDQAMPWCWSLVLGFVSCGFVSFGFGFGLGCVALRLPAGARSSHGA